MAQCQCRRSARFCSWTLVFLIYISDLPDNLISSSKLFADDTSIFSTVLDINRSSEALNQDLIKDWATQWKMSFNPDLNKQATGVVFSAKPPQLTTHCCILMVPQLFHLATKNILA